MFARGFQRKRGISISSSCAAPRFSFLPCDHYRSAMRTQESLVAGIFMENWSGFHGETLILNTVETLETRKNSLLLLIVRLLVFCNCWLSSFARWLLWPEFKEVQSKWKNTQLRIFVQIRIFTKVLEEMREKLISPCKCYNEYFISYASCNFAYCMRRARFCISRFSTNAWRLYRSVVAGKRYALDASNLLGKLRLFHLYNSFFLLKITIPLSRYMVLLFAYYTQYLKFFYPSFPLHPLYLLFLTLFLIYRLRYFTFFSHMLQCIFFLLQFTYIIVIILKYDVDIICNCRRDKNIYFH